MGRAWEEEGGQLSITLGNVQRKNEQSHALEELVQLQDVKDYSRHIPEDLSQALTLAEMGCG